MAATAVAQSHRTLREDRVETTLLALVQVVSEVADNEREVVATVVSLLRSGRVRLIGTFRDTPLTCF